MLIPFAGYTFVGAIIAGSLYAGFTQIPGLALEYAANVVLFAVLWFAAKRQDWGEFMNQTDHNRQNKIAVINDFQDLGDALLQSPFL